MKLQAIKSAPLKNMTGGKVYTCQMLITQKGSLMVIFFDDSGKWTMADHWEFVPVDGGE